MSKQICSVRKILEDIQNVSEECSEGRNSESENKQIESEDDLFNIEEVESNETLSLKINKLKTQPRRNPDATQTQPKRNIISGKTKTAFSVIIDNNIISYTKNVREQSGIQHLKTDKFALISNVWNRFIKNSPNNYKSDMNLTVDELFSAKRHVTIDNFFMSTSLATKLLEKQTTLVGTMRSNRRELLNLRKINQRQNETFVDNYL
ncbi:hypothetical protein HZH68_015700 [Vespula germanica]|uniref:PiggyBac transposable element-derived protein domain-containing protein n=1 Tax=Vespula germanica TaxID=30212 RepID=A0A834MQP8_VESGE|nr:hypothetical protein HZH68_015700 [Vespula germanica]